MRTTCLKQTKPPAHCSTIHQRLFGQEGHSASAIPAEILVDPAVTTKPNGRPPIDGAVISVRTTNLQHSSSTASGAVSGNLFTIFSFQSFTASAAKRQSSALAGAPAEAPAHATSGPRVTDAWLLSSMGLIAMCISSLIWRCPRPPDAQPLPVRRCPQP